MDTADPNLWLNGLQAAFTYCDADGIIQHMNAVSLKTFSSLEDGDSLVGTNVLDCHPEPARSKLLDLLEDPRLNVYTIEKNGRRKIIYQAPVMIAGQFSGIVEISLPIPDEFPHFIRQES